MSVRVVGPPGYRGLLERRPARFLVCSLAVFGAEQLAGAVGIAVAYARINRKRTS